MDLLSRICGALAVGSTTDPLGRSLLVEQFRVLHKQVPVLYAVLLIDSISVGLELPASISPWLRFAVPRRAPPDLPRSVDPAGTPGRCRIQPRAGLS